jgi:hypothetical protein
VCQSILYDSERYFPPPGKNLNLNPYKGRLTLVSLWGKGNVAESFGHFWKVVPGRQLMIRPREHVNKMEEDGAPHCKPRLN